MLFLPDICFNLVLISSYFFWREAKKPLKFSFFSGSARLLLVFFSFNDRLNFVIFMINSKQEWYVFVDILLHGVLTFMLTLSQELQDILGDQRIIEDIYRHIEESDREIFRFIEDKLL